MNYYVSFAISGLMNILGLLIFWIVRAWRNMDILMLTQRGSYASLLFSACPFISLAESVFCKCWLSVASWCLDFFFKISVCVYNLSDEFIKISYHCPLFKISISQSDKNNRKYKKSLVTLSLPTQTSFTSFPSSIVALPDIPTW